MKALIDNLINERYPEQPPVFKGEKKYLTKTVSDFTTFQLIIFEEGSKVNPRLNWNSPKLVFNKINLN